MANDDQQSEGQEHYIHDYEGAATEQIFTGRTADVHGAFFLPYLKPGMSLLDCGCGPGTITLGFAEVVSPGRVIGMDVEESQVEIARSNAETVGLSNATFETANIYELPFDDNSFDAAFCHGVLDHLTDPLKALQEMRRVLKPGGVIGVRSGNWAGNIIAPANETLRDAVDIYCKFRQHNGGNPFIGMDLRALLRESGFVNNEASASYQCFGTTEATKSIKDVALSEFTGPEISRQAINMGWADQSKLDEISAAVKEWCEHPDAVFFDSWGEAVGWKE